MKKFRMQHVEEIEKLMAEGKIVIVEWHTPYEKGNKIETVESVR